MPGLTGGDWKRATKTEPRQSPTLLGVILHSHHYRDSSYCLEEARRLYDAYLAKRVILLPVKLDDAQVIDLLGGIQYERAGELTTAEIVQNLLRRVNEGVRL